MKSPKVLYIAAECKPFAKTGGVGDVAGELPLYLKKAGIDIELAIPLYGVIGKNHVGEKKYSYTVNYNGKKENVTVYGGMLNGEVPVNFIHNPTWFEGNYSTPYIYSTSAPYWDDGLRFCFFAKALLGLIYRMDPDYVHANDWPAGYLFGYMEMEGLKNKRILTIHNIGYQGSMHKSIISGLDMEKILFHQKTGCYFEMGDAVNPLKLAMELADMTNTVSPNYALEMTRPENGYRFFEGGKGIDAIARRHFENGTLIGILNGFVYKDEATDAGFGSILEKKAAAKKDLGKYFADPDHFLLGFVGRSVEQKFRLLSEYVDGRSVLEHILDIPRVNAAFLATGEEKYEAFMGNVATRRFDWFIGYDHLLAISRRKNYLSVIAFDRTLAANISLGCDVFLMPSLYEPCGITQLESMACATPPLVRWTGGLADTVKPHNKPDGTGFGFDGYDREGVLRGLINSVHESHRIYREDPEAFRLIQKNAFFSRFGWETAAREYISRLYKL